MKESRMFESSRANARQQAADTIELNITLGTNLARTYDIAVDAAIIAHERGVLRAVVEYLCETAEELDAQENPDPGGFVFDAVASLIYAAMDLESGIPVEDRSVRTE
jgi:hypothetical protein